MGSAWVEHVKSVYAKGKKNGMSYKQAMQKAKASWAKKKGGKAAAAPKKKAAKKEADDEKVAGPPKRAKKKARKQVVANGQQAQEEPQSSKKARSSRVSRKTKSIKRRDVVPTKGIAGVGAPYKE